MTCGSKNTIYFLKKNCAFWWELGGGKTASSFSKRCRYQTVAISALKKRRQITNLHLKKHNITIFHFCIGLEFIEPVAFDLDFTS